MMFGCNINIKDHRIRLCYLPVYGEFDDLCCCLGICCSNDVGHKNCDSLYCPWLCCFVTRYYYCFPMCCTCIDDRKHQAVIGGLYFIVEVPSKNGPIAQCCLCCGLCRGESNDDKLRANVCFCFLYETSVPNIRHWKTGEDPDFDYSLLHESRVHTETNQCLLCSKVLFSRTVIYKSFHSFKVLYDLQTSEYYDDNVRLIVNEYIPSLPFSPALEYMYT